MQAGVFGMPNSGILFDGWMVTEISGPEWITGGAVGLEATYLSVGLDFLIGIVVLMMAIKAGKLVAPGLKSKTEQLIVWAYLINSIYYRNIYILISRSASSRQATG